MVTSTPLGRDGTFAELFAKARNGEIPGAAAFHAPTSANPMIDETYLAEQEAVLGHDDFRREFGAEFIAGGASFIEHSSSPERSTTLRALRLGSRAVDEDPRGASLVRPSLRHRATS